MFRKLVSVDEAKRVLARSFTPRPVGPEVVALSEAYGRVLADDVVSSYDIPPFNRSTVDGYAVKASDTFGAEENRPVTLRLTGRVNVGEAPKARVQKGTLAEIVTGAPIPRSADAVVMIEYTERKGDSVLVRQAVSHGENVMKAGSDIRKGEIVLKKGTTLSPYEIGALAAVGSVKANVYKRPIVAIFSTGAEVIEPGKPLTPGKIFDINAHALSAAVEECGCEPRNMGIVQDEPSQMTTALQEALKTADLVITSGGVSVGPTDIIPKVLNTLGKPGVVVYGIAIRPGKPTAIALVNGKPVFSLPGHPASSLMIFHLFVRPSYRHYYFGDYYAVGYEGLGFHPWFQYHGHQGFDPVGSSMELAIWITVSFLFGAACSVFAGFIGMYVSIRANIRVATAALESLNRALQIALRAGGTSQRAGRTEKFRRPSAAARLAVWAIAGMVVSNPAPKNTISLDGERRASSRASSGE